MRRTLFATAALLLGVVSVGLAVQAQRARRNAKRGEPGVVLPTQPVVGTTATATPAAPPAPRVTSWPLRLAVARPGLREPNRVEIEPGTYRLGKAAPCSARASRFHLEEVRVTRHAGQVDDELLILASFQNADRVPCEAPRWEAWTHGVRNGRERGAGGYVRPGETAFFEERFGLGKRTTHVEIVVDPGRGGPPKIVVDLETGAVEGGGGAFGGAPQPLPVDRLARSDDPGPLSVRRIHVGARLPAVSLEIPGYRELPGTTRKGEQTCTRLEDLALDDVYLARDEARPGAPIWVLVDAVFLKLGRVQAVRCQRFSAGYAVLLGSDARAARARTDAPQVGRSAFARWPVQAGTASVRLGFGDTGSPTDELEIDLEHGTARITKRARAPWPGRYEVDVAGAWSESQADPEGWAMAKAFGGCGLPPTRAARLAAICENDEPLGQRPVPATLHLHPHEELRARLCPKPEPIPSPLPSPSPTGGVAD